MLRRGRSAVVVAALVLAAGSAAACSSGGSSPLGEAGSGSLKDVLKNVRATSQPSGFIEYDDQVQLAKLSAGTTANPAPGPSSPIGAVLGIGADYLSQYSAVRPPLLGFDASAATSAVTVGIEPNAVGILYGSFDTGAIGAKLEAWGYRKQNRGGGVTAWIYQADPKVNANAIILANNGIGPGTIPFLNAIWVSKSSIAYGTSASIVAAAFPAQPASMADDPTVGPLTDCLGPTPAAIVVTDPTRINNSAISAIALGLTATSTADLRDEMCVSAPDDAGAQAFASGFTHAITSGYDSKRNEPWSTSFSDPQATVIGGAAHVVRLSAKPTGIVPGSFFNQFYSDDFAGLLGLPVGAQS